MSKESKRLQGQRNQSSEQSDSSKTPPFTPYAFPPAPAPSLPRAQCTSCTDSQCKLPGDRTRTAKQPRTHSLASRHVLNMFFMWKSWTRSSWRGRGDKESANRAWSLAKQICPIPCAAEITAAPQLLLLCFQSAYITQGKVSTTTVMCSRR